MRNRVLRLILLTLAITACVTVHTNSTLIDPSAHYAKTCPKSVKLYPNPDSIGRPYQHVALLNSTGEIKYSDEAEMFESMREEAAALGANGIVLGQFDEPGALSQIAANTTQVPLKRRAQAMAIWVPSDAQHTASVCANEKPRSALSSFWRWLRGG
jgi:hypothetical protein